MTRKVKWLKLVCPTCKGVFEVPPHQSNRKFCCLKCCGESLKNIKISEAHKNKIRLSKINKKRPGVGIKISLANKGKPKPHTKEWNENLSKALKGIKSHRLNKKLSKEHRQNMSKAAIKRILKGENKSKLYKTGYFYSTLNNKKYWYRSGLELQAYKFLDDRDSKSIIKSWRPCKFYLKYKWPDNSIHRYLPDIFVEYKSGKKQIIEIKPVDYLERNYDNCLEKAEAGEKFCKENDMVYSIWTEKELKGVV